MVGNMKKGLSPVVATVVLVVAAIVVGALATVWVSGWVGQSTSRAGDTDCAISTAYRVENVKYDQTNGSLSMRLVNTGTATVGNFTLDVELLNGTITTSNSPIADQSVNVTTGQSVFLNIDANWTSATLNSVKVRNNKCKNYFVTVKGDDITVV